MWADRPVPLWTFAEMLIHKRAIWTSTCHNNCMKSLYLLLAFSALLIVTPVTAQSSAVKPDNTKTNQADRNPGEPTADRQGSAASDIKLTAAIRRALVADKTLSTYAHNIKIITRNGIVTLKGPIRSDAEMQSLIGKAAEISGRPDDVVNQMSVKR